MFSSFEDQVKIPSKFASTKKMDSSPIYRLEVPKFDEKCSFMIWKIKMEDCLEGADLGDALLENKPDHLTDEEWARMNKKAATLLRAGLADNIINQVL